MNQNYSPKNIYQVTGKDVTIIISDKLKNQIQYLCSKINNVEWSATLLYKFKKGDFDKQSCTIIAQELFLQDIGSEAYTEYTYNSDFTDYIMANPELIDSLYGHVH